MSDFHQINFHENKPNQYFYLIITDSDCLCTILNLNNIKKNLLHLGENLTVVLIGQISDDLNKNYIKELSKTINIIYDEKKVIYQYRTAIGKPIFIHTYGDKLKYGKIVNDADIQLINNYVSKNMFTRL